MSQIIPMEEGTAANQASGETSVVVQQADQQAQGTPKRKKKKKKKKKKSLKIVTPENCLFLQKIKEEKNPHKKLAQLQCFANMLFAHAQIFKALNEVRILIPILDELQQYRVLSDGQFVRGLELVIEGDVPSDLCEGGKEYILKEHKGFGQVWSLKVITPHGIAAGLQLSPFIRDRNPSQRAIDSLDHYLNHEEQEVVGVAGFVKHYLYTYKFVNSINQMPHIVSGASLDFINTQQDPGTILALDCVFGEHAKPVIKELSDVPEAFKLAAECLCCYMQDADGKDDTYTVFIGDTFRYLKHDLDIFCKKVEKQKQGYESLYKAIHEEITQTLTSIRSPQFKRKLQVQYKTKLKIVLPINITKDWLKNNIILPKCISYTNEDTDVNDASPSNKIIKNKKKKQKKKKSPARRKKTAKKEKLVDKKSKEEESEQELESPLIEAKQHEGYSPACYDKRVLSWFDDAHAKNYDAESVLYHSFPLVADSYIFSLGIQTEWHNKSKQGQIDTNYSLGGEIQYKNNNRKSVVFTCCKDPNNICYHRGYTAKEKNSLFGEYFANNQWKVMLRDDFPPLGKQQEDQRFQPQQKGDAVIEQDDDLCVRIRDNRLGVRIVLYKLNKELH